MDVIDSAVVFSFFGEIKLCRKTAIRQLGVVSITALTVRHFCTANSPYNSRPAGDRQVLFDSSVR